MYFVLTFTFTGSEMLKEIFLRTPWSWCKPQPLQLLSAAENPLPSSVCQARAGSGMQHRSTHHCFRRKALDAGVRRTPVGSPVRPRCRGFASQHHSGPLFNSNISDFSATCQLKNYLSLDTTESPPRCDTGSVLSRRNISINYLLPFIIITRICPYMQRNNKMCLVYSRSHTCVLMPMCICMLTKISTFTYAYIHVYTRNRRRTFQEIISKCRRNSWFIHHADPKTKYKDRLTFHSTL